MKIKPGQVFAGRFELQHELGSDHTGTVWVANDGWWDCRVVLKFLPGEISQDKDVLGDLKKKTHSWIGLSHPNIARVYDFVESGSRSAISMEYVDGPTLLELRLTKPNQVFEVNDLKVWVRELCEALEHAHQHSHFEHDLRATNLRVDSANHLKVVGFGITRLVNKLTSGLHSPTGALFDESPDQSLEGKSKAADNLRALGATLYELLTGTSPFSAGATGVQGGVPPLMAVRRAERGVIGEAIPKHWERTVAACLAKEPEQRPGSAAEVRQRLELEDADDDDQDERLERLNWLYVLTNRDEGRLQADMGEEHSGIAADFLSPKVVVALRGGETSKILEQLENAGLAAGGMPRKGHGSHFRERRQRFVTFGVKRLSIPDTEICEYLTYRFARQSALQLGFNHWDDLLGFRSEPRSFDFGEQVRQKATLERWLLTEDHLQGSRGILPGETADKNWKPINQDWMEGMPRLAALAERCSRQAGWLSELERLAIQRYTETFRGLGVQRFYEMKAGSRRERALFISARIEQELFGEWQAGAKSMYDAARVLEALRIVLEKRLGDLAKQITVHQEHEQRASGLILENRDKYARIGIVGAILGWRKSLLKAHAGYLRDMYIHRTLSQASGLERLLLQDLIAEVIRLSSNVQEAAALLNDAAAAFETHSAALCNGEQTRDRSDAQIRVYDAARAHEFGRRLDLDKTEQARHAQAVRTAMVDQAGPDATFSCLARISRQRFLDVIERECKASARTAHEAAIARGRPADASPGANLMGHLQREFAGRPDDLRHFIDDLVDYAARFLGFGGEATSTASRFVALAPKKVQRCLVVLPKAPEHASFGEEIKGLIRRQRLFRGVPVEFKENAENASEITFLTASNPSPQH